MADSVHSLVSPSYLHLLCKCPKALAFDPLDNQEDGEAAQRGTLQHAYLCEKLSIYFNKDYEKVDVNELTPDEVSEVNEVYEYIIQRYIRLKCRCKDPIVLIEEKLDLNDFLPKDSWGYVDFAVITDATIYVFDAKFGRVRVEIKDLENNPNPQLCAYAGGCYYRYKGKRHLNRINLTIAQPKLNNFPSFTLSVKHMLNYFRDVVTPATYKAVNGEGTYAPNDECKYCRLKNHCRAYASSVIAQMQLNEDLPETLSDDEIDFLLTKIPAFKKWCDNIWNYAIKKSETEGKKWSHYVLTSGRPTRVFTDTDKVVEMARDAGYDGIVETSVISVAQAEKLMGKSNFNEVLGDYVTYKPGKNTLVADDPRNHKSSLYNEFKGDK